MAESFKPPQAVQAAARRGLELRRRYNRGGLSNSQASSQGIGSGVQRASDLASGDSVSMSTISRMNSFFARHSRNYRPNEKERDGGPTAGTIAFLLWGGKPGERWARGIANRSKKNDDPPGTGRTGSNRNEPGSASSSSGDIEIGEATESSLRQKVSDHNENSEHKVTIGMLKAVYRRGAGAYSTSARAQSRNQWAMARVNAFLKLVRSGTPSNSNYTQDNDLLPSSHARASKCMEVQVLKIDKSLGIVFGYGIVSKINGEEYFDTQGDHIPEDSMLKATADYMAGDRVVKNMHRGGNVGKVVFGFPITADIAGALSIKADKTGFILGMKPDNDEILSKFQSGEYTGFSLGGRRIVDEVVNE